MNVAAKLLILCAAIFAAAYVLAKLFVPDVVPIGFEDTEQPIWQVVIAFLLRAIENVAVLGAIVVAVAAISQAVDRQRRSLPR